MFESRYSDQHGPASHEAGLFVGGTPQNGKLTQPKTASSTSVATAEISSDPTQPSRLENKKNIGAAVRTSGRTGPGS